MDDFFLSDTISNGVMGVMALLPLFFVLLVMFQIGHLNVSVRKLSKQIMQELLE